MLIRPACGRRRAAHHAPLLKEASFPGAQQRCQRQRYVNTASSSHTVAGGLDGRRGISGIEAPSAHTCQWQVLLCILCPTICAHGHHSPRNA